MLHPAFNREPVARKLQKGEGSLGAAGLGLPTAVLLRGQHKGTSSKHKGVYPVGRQCLEQDAQRQLPSPTGDPLEPASEVRWGRSAVPTWMYSPLPCSGIYFHEKSYKGLHIKYHLLIHLHWEDSN